MSELTPNSDLRDVIRDAIDNWLVAQGGGYVAAYVVGMEYVNDEGQSVLYMGSAPGQLTYRSMGLVRYMDEWWADDAIAAWNQQGLYPEPDDD